MLNKKLILFLFIFIIGFNNNVEAQATGKGKENIQNILTKVYKSFCDYSTPETDLLDKSIGNIIQNRMLWIMAILILISISFKAIKVIGDPNEEFGKALFFKPLMLYLFLMFYPIIMGGVNDIAELVTFKNIGENKVEIITQYKQTVNLSFFQQLTFFRSDEYLLQQEMADYDNRNTTNTETYSALQIYRNKELQKLLRISEKIKAAKENKEELSEEDLAEINKIIESEYENKFFVKHFKNFSYWVGDGISTVMRIFQTVILIILFIGGPLAIVLEIPFPGSLKKWFGIFIHTHLWTPIIFLLDMIALSLNNELGLNDKSGANGFVTFVVQIVIIALYIIIAKIASYFIQSQEGGGVLGATAYTTIQHIGKGIQKGMGGGGGLAGAFKGTLGKK